MSLSGDLSTLDLADLLQNLERHGQTGMLALEGEPAACLYLKDGRLTLLSTEERPTLIEVLVASGELASETLAAARRKRKGSRRSLGETLAAMGEIEVEALTALARERLVSDACEILSSEAGGFTFEPGPAPRGVFDPEERKLGLAIPIGPLLLEAARRTDHWRRIRERVPSDSTHYKVERRRRPKELEGDTLTGVLLELCDGTRSVAEVVAGVPHRRFEAYERLSTLVDERCLRPIEVADLAAAALELAREDPERAAELVRRGRALHGRHPALLEAEVALAEARAEPEAAVEALKLVAHHALEAGDRAASRAALERAIGLDPEDAALRERALELALAEGRIEAALQEGRALVGLHRAPGLHKKALAVLVRLREHAPDDWSLCLEHATSLVDSGAADRAVEVLLEFGAEALAREDYDRAREVHEQALALDPAREDVRATVLDLESGAFARRVAWRKQALRRALVGVVFVTFAAWTTAEGIARRAFVDALATISRETLVEEGRYEEAADRLEAVRAGHPFAWSLRGDLARYVAEVRARAD